MYYGNLIKRTGLISALVLITLVQRGFGQSQTVTFQQLDSLQRIERRPVLVFIHTDWCRYCQAMENTTFQDESVTTQLRQAYYWVSLNAESKQDITVQGQVFRYQPTGQGTGQHELAQALGTVDGTLTFPTLCFLNADYEIIHQQSGFVRARQLTDMLEAVSGEEVDRL